MHMEHPNCFLQNTCGGREVCLSIQKMLWEPYVINAAEIIYMKDPWNEVARSHQASLWQWKIHVFLSLPFHEVDDAAGAIAAMSGTGMSTNPCHIFDSRTSIYIKNGPKTAL